MHLYVFLTTVGFPLLMSCPTSWKMLLQLTLLSTEPLFTMTATARRICSRTYFWRLEETGRRLVTESYSKCYRYEVNLNTDHQRGLRPVRTTKLHRNVVYEGAQLSQLQFVFFGLYNMGNFIAFFVFVSRCFCFF